MLAKLESYDILIFQISGMINGYKIYPELLNNEKSHRFHPIFEKQLYNALLLSDLIIGLKFLDLSFCLKNNVESAYFSRIVALNSCEMLFNSGRFMGNKEIKTIFQKINCQDLESRFKEIQKEIYTQKDNQAYLKNIRINIIAHKDENPFKQIKIYENLDFSKIYNIGKILFEIHIKISSLFLDVLNKM